MALQTQSPPRRDRAFRRVVLTVVGLAALAGLYPVGRYAWASAQYRSSLRAMERREFEEARRRLDSCLRQWPSSAEVHFQAARAARRANDIPEARRLLKEAQRLGWVREAIDLEQILLEVQQGKYRNHSATLADVMRRGHPESLLIVEVLAPAALNSYELDLAYECLELWVKLEPDNPRPLILQGDLQERVSHDQEAATFYDQAVQLAPDNADARWRLGRKLLDLNSPGTAREHLDWMWHRRPEDADVKRAMAHCLYQVGEHERARTILDQLLAQAPDDAQGLYVRGLLELNGGQGAEAAEPYLRRAAALLPYETNVTYNLSVCLDRLGKEKEAADVRQRSQQASDDIRKVEELTRKVAKNPKDPELRRQIAIRYMRNGLEMEGKRWLESALNLDPRDVASHQVMVEHYLRFGDQRGAEEHRGIIRQVLRPGKATTKRP